jgi:hypothetical protein
VSNNAQLVSKKTKNVSKKPMILKQTPQKMVKDIQLTEIQLKDIKLNRRPQQLPNATKKLPMGSLPMGPLPIGLLRRRNQTRRRNQIRKRNQIRLL